MGPDELHGTFQPGFFPVISTGPGWHGIIRELDRNLHAVSPGYTIAQIKEKFGGLRYYADPAEDTDPELVRVFRKLIDGAEQASYFTCEECGQRGRTVVKEWRHTTLCEEHSP